MLKERAIIWNKAGHNVIFVSLGSCDVYGAVYKHPIIYDILSNLEFSQDQIKILFVNAIDLLNDDKKRNQGVSNNVRENSSCQKEDNLGFAIKMMQKVLRKEITVWDLEKNIMKNHNIDFKNAADFYNTRRTQLDEEYSQQKDVYELLVAYIKQHPDNTYYVDELPILLSKTCKSSLNHKYLTPQGTDNFYYLKNYNEKLYIICY